jgi:IclR family acetate operon transcriptional repressor
VESPKSVRLAARPGDRDPIHCTALGKAIASTLDPERVRAILAAEGMPRRTRKTITSVRAYLTELDRVRELGYAIDDQENEEEGRCVAVPLVGIGLPASISLAAPASRFSADRIPAVAADLRRAAEVLVRDFTGTRAD